MRRRRKKSYSIWDCPLVFFCNVYQRFGPNFWKRNYFATTFDHFRSKHYFFKVANELARVLHINRSINLRLSKAMIHIVLFSGSSSIFLTMDLDGERREKQEKLGKTSRLHCNNEILAFQIKWSKFCLCVFRSIS